MTHRRVFSSVLESNAAQRFLLSVSYWWHRSEKRSITWVVGPDEIASMVANIAAALPGSHSVSLSDYRFAGTAYDSTTSESDGTRLPFAGHRLILGPWLLGKLARRAEGFIYVGSSGFLHSADARMHEFAYLRSKGVRIACYFTGNDIRSPQLMKELQKSTGLENIGTYLAEVNPVFATESYEAEKKQIAKISEQYADTIFNARVDQLSHLTRETEPFLYFYPDSDFVADWQKFDTTDPLIIVHAPSAPILKGTQVVRAAIASLRERGYSFEYVELINKSHDEVIIALRSAHIALNEFYAFVPGVFGVEALAAGCALLTRADETIETDLPEGSNTAWLVTSPHQILDNLTHLLDNPSEARKLAERGHSWAQENVAASRSSERLRVSLTRHTAQGNSREALR